MSNNANTGIGLGGMLFLLFLGLKLTGHIDWAWYWVAAPLFVQLGLVMLLVLPAILRESRK